MVGETTHHQQLSLERAGDFPTVTLLNRLASAPLP